MKRVLVFVIFTLPFAGFQSLTSQTGSMKGTVDTAVPRPPATLPNESLESAALRELLDYSAAVGSSHWEGMQGEGLMTYGASEDAATHKATLIISRAGQTRLDVTKDDGITSLRLNGFSGQLKAFNKRAQPLPLRNIAVGLIAFPRVLAQSFAKDGLVVTDGGMVNLEGRALHRVSIQQPTFPGQPKASIDRTSVVIDLYFGSDHLLYNSAALVESLSQTRQQYLEVLSYADYRSVDGFEIPFHISASLEGQRTWTLTLSSVQSTPTTTDFSF